MRKATFLAAVLASASLALTVAGADWYGAHGAFSSHETRKALLNKVAAETVPDAAVRGRIASALEALPPPRHKTVKDPVPESIREEHAAYFDTMAALARNPRAGTLPEPSPELAAYLEANMPLSQLKNNDTHYIDAARDVINGNIPDALRAEAAAVAAGERTPSPELAAIQGENALQAQKVRTLYAALQLFRDLDRRVIDASDNGFIS